MDSGRRIHVPAVSDMASGWAQNRHDGHFTINKSSWIHDLTFGLSWFIMLVLTWFCLSLSTRREVHLFLTWETCMYPLKSHHLISRSPFGVFPSVRVFLFMLTPPKTGKNGILAHLCSSARETFPLASCHMVLRCSGVGKTGENNCENQGHQDLHKICDHLWKMDVHLALCAWCT